MTFDLALYSLQTHFWRLLNVSELGVAPRPRFLKALMMSVSPFLKTDQHDCLPLPENEPVVSAPLNAGNAAALFGSREA